MAYVESGHLAQTTARFHITIANFEHQIWHHDEFCRAFVNARAEVGERIWNECKHRVPGGGELSSPAQW